MSDPDWELPPVELPFEVADLDAIHPGGPLSGLSPDDRGFFVMPEAGVDQPAQWVSGQEVAEANHDAQVIVSNLINLIPEVGTAKGVVEAFRGKDLITGDELSWWERALDLAAGTTLLKGANEVKGILGGMGAAASRANQVLATKNAAGAAGGSD
jgi:hypothetical protein